MDRNTCFPSQTNVRIPFPPPLLLCGGPSYDALQAFSVLFRLTQAFSYDLNGQMGPSPLVPVYVNFSFLTPISSPSFFLAFFRSTSDYPFRFFSPPPVVQFSCTFTSTPTELSFLHVFLSYKPPCFFPPPNVSFFGFPRRRNTIGPIYRAVLSSSPYLPLFLSDCQGRAKEAFF